MDLTNSCSAFFHSFKEMTKETFPDESPRKCDKNSAITGTSRNNLDLLRRFIGQLKIFFTNKNTKESQFLCVLSGGI